jgi:hypothetical protein
MIGNVNSIWRQRRIGSVLKEAPNDYPTGTFDGTGNYILIGNSIYNTTAYSIAFRVKSSDQSGGVCYSEGNTASSTQHLRIGPDVAGAKLRVFLRDDASVTKINNVLTNTDVFTGADKSIVFTDQAGTVKVYINGVEDANSIAGNFNYTPNTTTFNQSGIGALVRSVVSNYLSGQEYDVFLFNDILTAQEASDYHNNVLILGNVVGGYPVSEGNGSKAYDVSGNNNHGDWNGVLTNIHANKQNIFSYNNKYGYELYQHIELITNGGFDTDSDWVKDGTWTISGGTANGVNSGILALSQLNVVTAGKKYRVTYTISNYISGTLRFQLEGGGTGNGTIRSSEGTFIEDVVAAGTGRIYFSGVSFNGSIDNVSVKELGEEITVPAKLDGTLITPTIAGYTKRYDVK